MKKYVISFLFCLSAILLSAQDYLISFAGNGASTTVDSVKVENLTQGTNLTMQGNHVLHLKSNITGVSPINQIQFDGVRFYPNPMTEFTQMEFDIPESGLTQIELYNISGRIIAQTNNYLNEGRHNYQITGLGSGVYFARIKSAGITRTGKFVSNNSVSGNPGLTYTQSLPDNETTEALKNATTEVLMQYTNGDRLIFTGISGNYRTVVTDVPAGSKTLPFTFIPCTDADGKNYPVVKIGDQWWMAENLAYLPAVSPPTVGSNTAPYYYIYGYEGADVAAAKNNTNYATYGVLLNWTAALTACPSGWHLPSDAEWKQLEMALGMTQAQVDELYYRGTEQGTQMKTTTGWNSNGNGTNTSGFLGLPGGCRYSGGNFYNIGIYGYWWSSTEGTTSTAWSRLLTYNYTNVYRNYYYKGSGFSIRCVRD